MMSPRPGTPSAPDRRGTLHLVGHAHIDPVWLWQWQEGMAEVRATWRSALDRMREYPEMRFTASSAAFYAWVDTAVQLVFFRSHAHAQREDAKHAFKIVPLTHQTLGQDVDRSTQSKKHTRVIM